MLLNNLGYSHYLAGHYTLAEQHFRMAVGIDATHHTATAQIEW